MTVPYAFQLDPWQVEERGTVAETAIFTLKKRFCASRRDATRRGEYVYLDAPNWVNVVAVTPQDEILLIEQFRQGSATMTLEIPGGAIDPGEDPMTAGLRELYEESGYRGQSPRSLGSCQPNPAFLNNRCYFFTVRDAVQVGPGAPDAGEEIHVRAVPFAEVRELVRGGVIDHAIIVAALARFFDQLDCDAGTGPSPD